MSQPSRRRAATRAILFVFVALATAILMLAPFDRSHAAGKQSVRITAGPTYGPTDVQAGNEITLEVSARQTNEEWLAFRIDWGDGTTTDSGLLFVDQTTRTFRKTFDDAGTYHVVVTVYHGWKSGQFGVGPFKLKHSKFIDVKVAPNLPLQVGILTINGDTIKSVGKTVKNKKERKFEIAGNVTINSVITLDNKVVADLDKNTVTVSGNLGIPQAGPYARFLSMGKDVTIDANTGAFVSVDLPNLNSEFNLGGFVIKFENVKITNDGIIFDFAFTAPRLARGVVNPCDDDGGTNSDDEPGKLLDLSLKMLKVNRTPPYLHVLGDVSVAAENVTLPGTSYGLSKVQVGFAVEPKEKYFGTLEVCLPSNRALGGTIEIFDGKLNKLGFILGAKIPIFTFSGGTADAIVLTRLTGEVRNISNGLTPEISCGAFDPVTGIVSEIGFGAEWAVGIPIAGLTAAPVALEGAATFDANWNMTVGGDIVLFGKPDLRVAQARGKYTARQGGGVWALVGKFNLKGVISLDGTFETSFNASDAYVKGFAKGSFGLPPDHWATKFAPAGQGNGAILVLVRATPLERTLAGASGTVVLPVLGLRTVRFQIDLKTGEITTDLDKEVLQILASGKAAVEQTTLTGGQGAGGMIVELAHESVAPVDFNIRFPDGTLITPNDADGTTIAYAAGGDGEPSVYLIGNAPDGQYSAEFDETGIGDYSVTFSTPRVDPVLQVLGPTVDTSVARYDELPVSYDVTGLPSDATVRVYLDDNDSWGGGTLIGTATVQDGQLTGVIGDALPGDYNVMLEVDTGDGPPEHVYGGATVTVRDYLTVGAFKGKLLDSTKPRKDKLTISGKFNFDGARPAKLFDEQTETLSLELGDADDPFRLDIPPGHAGWNVNGKGVMKWKTAKGVTPKISVLIDPNKGKFKFSVSKASFVQPPANPLGMSLVFGNDETLRYETWTESKPGSFKVKIK